MSSSKRYATFKQMKYRKQTTTPRPFNQVSTTLTRKKTLKQDGTKWSGITATDKEKASVRVPVDDTDVTSLCEKSVDPNQYGTNDVANYSAAELSIIEDIHSAYIKYLRRPCDETALCSLLARFLRDSMTVEKLEDQLQKSVEFRAKERQFKEFWSHVSKTPRRISAETRKKSLIIKYVGIYGTSGIAKAALGYLEALETLENVIVVFEPSLVQYPPNEEIRNSQCDSRAYTRLFKCASPVIVSSSSVSLSSPRVSSFGRFESNKRDRTSEIKQIREQKPEQGHETKEDTASVERQAQPDLIILHGDPSHWAHYVQRARKSHCNATIAGLLVWESDTLPEIWKKHVDSVDVVLVPCLWNADIVRKSSPQADIFVWHHFIAKNTSFSLPLQQKRSVVTTNELPASITTTTTTDTGTAAKPVFVFHSQGNLIGLPTAFCNIPTKSVKILCVGQWNARKNIHGAIETYLDTFTASDDVVFYVKTFSTYGESDNRLFEWLVQYWKGRQLSRTTTGNNKMLPTLVLDLQCHSERYMNHLYEWCDIFFSMARAEGVGLGACTAYDFGKRVVMPSYGGQVDYVHTPYWIRWKKQTASFCEDPVEDHTMCRVGKCRYNVCLDSSHLWAEPLSVDATNKLISAYHDTIADLSNDRMSENVKRSMKHTDRLPSASTIGKQFVSILRTIAMKTHDHPLSLQVSQIHPK